MKFDMIKLAITYLFLHFVGPSKWIVLNNNICYSRDQPATIQIHTSRKLFAIRLLHISGGFYCESNQNISNWGCDFGNCENDNCHTTVIKRKSDNSEYPNTRDAQILDSNYLMNFPGFSIKDDLLIFKQREWLSVIDKEEFEILVYTPFHGLLGQSHCVQVDASFL